MSNTSDQLGGTIKLLIAIFVLALVMQSSTCGKCSSARYKRSTEYAEGRIKDFIEFAKDVVKQSGPLITNVVEQIPDTEEYTEYKLELMAFLIKLDRYKAHSGRCAAKSLEVMTAFLLLAETYEQENISREAKNVFNLMSSNGLPELETKATELIAAIDDDKFQSEYQEMLASGHNHNVSSMLMEIC